jgi:polyisoprenoid-binding protein YceI
MKRTLILLLLAILIAAAASAQDRYFTRGGKIYFDATSSSEKIESINNQGTSVFDTKTGQFEFAVLMKGFEFEKALMQDHFHENYVESEKYPKSVFKGTIVDLTKIDFSKDGVYAATVKGNLSLHGVTKEVIAPATFAIKGGKISAKASFKILLADFNVTIPSLVADKVSKTASINVDATYDKMK